MSALLYPMGNISNLDVTLMDRTIADEFEDGSTSSRRLWSASNFKRRFTIQHNPLSLTSFNYLREFFSARSGRYDSFWFRDNVHRGGMANVRLSDMFKISRGGSMVYNLQVVLDEIAPKRLLPGIADISDLGFGTPIYWLDPNRIVHYQNAGSSVRENPIPNFAYSGFNAAGMSNTNGAYYLSGLTSDAYPSTAPVNGAHNGFTYGLLKSLDTTTLLGTSGSTWFGFVRHPVSATKRVICAFGKMGAHKAFGLALAADNFYEPWIGASETWTNARKENSAADTWRSFAVTGAPTVGSGKLYINGALIGTDAYTAVGDETLSYFAINQAIDGTLTAADTSTGGVSQAMYFNGVLTLAQVKLLHNLFCYQYGLATV